MDQIELEKQYRLVDMVVPAGISACTLQGYSLTLKPAPEYGEGMHTVRVPMNLVPECRSHRFLTLDEWERQVNAAKLAEATTGKAQSAALNAPENDRRVAERRVAHATAKAVKGVTAKRAAAAEPEPVVAVTPKVKLTTAAKKAAQKRKVTA